MKKWVGQCYIASQQKNQQLETNSAWRMLLLALKGKKDLEKVDEELAVITREAEIRSEQNEFHLNTQRAFKPLMKNMDWLDKKRRSEEERSRR